MEMKRKRNTENEEEKDREKILIPWSKNRKAEIEEELRGRSNSSCSSSPKWDFDALTRIASLENAKNESLKIFIEEEKMNNKDPWIPCRTRPRLPLPDWDSWIETYNELGGGDLVFVFEKKLFASDFCSVQHRLYLNRSEMEKVVCPAMTKEEEDLVMLKKGLRVMTVDQMGRRYNLNFTHWPSVNRYVFNRGWMKLAKENGLYVGSQVKTWFFRYGKNKKLGFILSCS